MLITNSMENISDKFIQELFQLSKLEIPGDVLMKARDCLIDYFGYTLAGSLITSDIHKQYIRYNICKGSCHIINGMQTTVVDMRTAAMINAYNAHVLELDDSHRSAMTHLGAPIFSGLMATAEVYQCSIVGVIKAAVIGYQAAIRLANAIQPGHKKKGFHVTGTCCTVGTAVAIAVLLEYSERELRNTFSAAVTTAAGLLAVISGDSQQKPYNAANAASAGMNAALYGKYFSGAVDILADPRGFFNAVTDRAEPERLFDHGYAISGIYQKLYASCRHCHAPIEAMLELRKKDGIVPEAISSIEVKTYDLAIRGHDHTDILGVSSAKQSIPYSIAAACIYQDCGLESYTEEKINNKDLLGLVKRVKVVEDKDLTRLVPEKRSAIVNIILKNGDEFSARVDYPKGEPENPLTEEELRHKYYALSESCGLEHSKAQSLFDLVQKADQEPVTELFDIICE